MQTAPSRATSKANADNANIRLRPKAGAKTSIKLKRTLPQLNKYPYFALKNANDRFFNAQSLSLAGKTPFSVVYENELVSLRHYSVQSLQAESAPLIIKKHRVPVVIVPPLAVNMLIYDLFPQRSFIRFLLQHGFEVYLIDWGKPSRKHAKYHLGTYIQKLLPEFLQQVRQHSGQDELSLHGWSLGGVFALTYTALYQDKKIRNIILQGSPIDTHKSGYMGKVYQFLNRRAQWVRQNTPFRLRQLPSQYFHIAGWQTTLGFKLTDPIGSLRGYWDLVKNLLDREEVANHATSSAFLDNMLAYPGGVARDLVLRFWIDNELSQGQMQFKDQTAYLKEVDSALLAMGSKSDNFVTADAVEPVLDLVSSQDKQFSYIPGGHMGIVSGKKAPTEIWPLIADWLDQRSD
ncbi:alpha/beta fold hydrolase [Alkanindiges sp. WGS2144]|uniref:alpha/beta fold hydrolase n=1 Tax=Alkanindiges sp. WGS2144 TaxID=3366808 RepID=UPI0037529AF4